MRILLRFHMACFMLMAVADPMRAQVTGRITGSVLDQSGSTIPSASVSLIMPAGLKPLLSTITTSDGLFNLSGVRPDFYDLVVEANGFRKHTIQGLKVDPAQETALPSITLYPESIDIKVEVVASVPSVQTANAEVSTSITNEQVRRLPVLDRSPLSLIKTQAGVSAGSNWTVINGERTSSSNVTMDGINIQDNYIRENGLNYSPNLLALDQVAELTIASSNADSTMAGGASHVVFVTPSGTNAFHGSGYFYNRNSVFSANTWFNNQSHIDRPDFNQNQVGGTFGGPIIKDKLYFYTNYEAFRWNTEITAYRTILTADARRGVFTYEDLQGRVQKVNLLEAMGIAADPATEQLLKSVPGPDKINNYYLGDSRESLLRNTAGYAFLVLGHHHRDNLTAKADYALSTRNVFTTTFLWNRQDVTRSDLSNDYSTVPKVSNDDGRKLLSAAWRWRPGTGFTNELRGGFNFAPLTFRTSEVFGDRIITGMIYSNPVNTFRLQGRNTDTFALMDNAVHVRGKNILQFGFQTQQIRVESFGEGGITASYLLGIGLGNPGLKSDKLPGVSAADLNSANQMLATLAGYVSGYAQTFNITSRTSGFVTGAPGKSHLSLNNYAIYLQNAWRMHSRLTLNLGLRYDLPSVVDERDSLALLPVLQNNSAVGTLLSNATLNFAGSSAGRPWYRRDKNNFAPNIGLAWDVFGDGKMALRAGYSISYVNDESIRAVENNVGANEGLAATASRTGLTGRVSEGLPQIPVPAFKVPRTMQENFSINPFTAFGLPDPNLRTPYVQQWSIGIQREIKNTILEARYVGNHSTKLYRAFDVNPELIRENGFLDDFKRALQNGNLARAATGVFDPSYNSKISGSQPLTVFPTLPYGGLLTNPIVSNLINTGQTGELAFTYQINGLNGPVAFYQNPYSLASNLITNYSNANYNALQVDVRRRMARGTQFQANYTYAKVLSDGNGTAQHRFEELRDPRNGKVDRARPIFDITHAIKANAVYDIPFGNGHLLNSRSLQPLLSGWAISGLMNWQSGSPFSILSKRGTLTRAFRAGGNTAASALDKARLDDLLQLRMTGVGPFIVDASAIGADGRGTASDGAPPFTGQAFSHPAPGEIGALQQRWFSGPWTFNLDLALMKNVRIKEKQSLELRAEAINTFNNVAWLVQDQDIGSTAFGRVTSTFNSPRRLQFSLHYWF